MQLGAVVVTGASTGIGENIALELDKMGVQVFAGVRKPADAAALKQKASGSLTPIFLDVTDEESIGQAAAQVAATVGEAGLTGLVNNAGIAVAGPLEFLPVAEFRKQMEVNVVGQVAVTQAFLPLLRKAKGRIVNMGSMSGRVTAPYLGPYSASKHALEALSGALRMELKPWGIHVSLVGPGAIDTPIWSKSSAAALSIVEGLPPEALRLYGEAIEAMQKNVANVRGIPPIEVFKAVHHALTAAQPKTRYTVGQDAKVAELGRLLPDEMRERIIRKRF